MQKIKILYGLEAAGGGALKHLVYLATRINKDYFDITAVLSDKRKENIENEVEKLRNNGVTIMIIPMRRSIHISDVLILIYLIIHMKKRKYNIVHAHSSKAGLLFRIAARINHVPCILYTPHCFYFLSQTGLKRLLFIKAEQVLGKMCHGIIVSDTEVKHITKNRIVKNSKIYNVNNAIDFNEYEQDRFIKETKQKYGIPEKAMVVGAIGRLTEQKDWPTFIKAAQIIVKAYPGTTFLIVGEGTLRKKLELLISELKLQHQIILTGYISEIHKIYSIIDIYVNSSLWEGLPYVLLEAMRYKKPIVATDIGYNDVIVETVNGLYAPPGDHQALAKMIVQLIESKMLIEKLGLNGYEMSLEKYSFEKFIKEHENIYLQNCS